MNGNDLMEDGSLANEWAAERGKGQAKWAEERLSGVAEHYGACSQKLTIIYAILLLFAPRRRQADVCHCLSVHLIWAERANRK